MRFGSVAQQETLAVLDPAPSGAAPTARLRSATRVATILVALALARPALGQAGDRKGENQSDVPAAYARTTAPVHAPDAALETFQIRAGLRMELVASEPLIFDPVACAFDEHERLWVVEMRGYMPNVDGEGEREPVGSISVLTDEDGDGAMDARSVFLDELVLPRSVAPYRGGALVLTPPHLLFCEDTDGDGRADATTIIAEGLGGIQSPEHAANGLVYTLDNWFRPANHRRRWSFASGDWRSEPIAGGGQWGISRDDWGRVFFNTNSDPLRCDLFDSRYAVRNPNLGTARGVNRRAAAEMAVWPALPTPGVNRGYQPQTLRDDGRLAAFTAACAPHVYRGSALGAGFAGNAFVCEPAGNLIKRYTLTSPDGLRVEARDPSPGLEFLTSTDERFRPVHLSDGPDGALYIVDMYRGILQHRIFMTSFLRKQVIARDLAAPIGYGRIWRVVRDDAASLARAGEQATQGAGALGDAAWNDLIAALGHTDGWWRDTAQRLIVEEGVGDIDVQRRLRDAFARSSSALERVHLLWSLHGVEGLTSALVAAALEDKHAEVRHAALRCSEAFAAAQPAIWLTRIASVARSGQPRVRHQALLSLGAVSDPRAVDLVVGLLASDASSRMERDAALVALYGREADALERIFASAKWSESAAGREDFVQLLARCAAHSRTLAPLERLFARAPNAPAWLRGAVAAGLAAGGERDSSGAWEAVRLEREPAGFDAFCSALPASAQPAAEQLRTSWVWDGKPGWVAPASARELSIEERAGFERGQRFYAITCASCHQDSGLGEPGKAPPLRRSRFVLGDEERLLKILLHGLAGPIEVRGARWDADMPQVQATDAELADLATYIRRAWGHAGDPVTPEGAAAVRAQHAERDRPWTAEELE